jgi:hypothetical protein
MQVIVNQKLSHYLYTTKRMYNIRIITCIIGLINIFCGKRMIIYLFDSIASGNEFFFKLAYLV